MSCKSSLYFLGTSPLTELWFVSIFSFCGESLPFLDNVPWSWSSSLTFPSTEAPTYEGPGLRTKSQYSQLVTPGVESPFRACRRNEGNETQPLRHIFSEFCLFKIELEGMRNSGGLPLQVRYCILWLGAEDTWSLIYLATPPGGVGREGGGHGLRQSRQDLMDIFFK